MTVNEIIRDILNVLDGIERQRDDSPSAYSDNDIKRFKQIVDLAEPPKCQPEYANEPNEQYADIDAVADNAGSDSWQGTKHPADIRGEHSSLYPGRVYGAR